MYIVKLMFLSNVGDFFLINKLLETQFCSEYISLKL